MSKNKQQSTEVEYLLPHQYKATIMPHIPGMVHVSIVIKQIEDAKLVSNAKATGAMKDYVVAYNAGLQQVIDMLETEQYENQLASQPVDY